MTVDRDEIDWIVVVAKTVSDEDLKNEAIKKLASIGINTDEINSRFESLRDEKSQKRAFDKALRIQSNRNEDESYSLAQGLLIIFLSPFILGIRTEYGDSYTDLIRSNYKRMAYQRVLLLILGAVIWISFTISVFNYFNSQWEREIEETDIKEWEKKRRL